MFLKELLAFRALYFIQGAFISFRALLFYSGRFYFIQGALFFLYNAFLILHSAFLFLHSALFSFLCESAALFLLFFQIVMQLLFQFLDVKRSSLDQCSEIFDDCVYQYQY
jgi:hypothetical protein